MDVLFLKYPTLPRQLSGKMLVRHKTGPCMMALDSVTSPDQEQKLRMRPGNHELIEVKES